MQKLHLGSGVCFIDSLIPILVGSSIVTLISFLAVKTVEVWLAPERDPRLPTATVVRDGIARSKPAQMRSRRELRELRSLREPGGFPDLCRDPVCCPWPPNA